MNRNSLTEVVPAASKKYDRISGIAWLFSIGLVVVAGYLGWDRWHGVDNLIKPVMPESAIRSAITTLPQLGKPIESLPVHDEVGLVDAIPRFVSMYTDIPNRPRQDVIEHLVSLGDSVFGIAQVFNIQPETVLWSNYDLLKDKQISFHPFEK